MRLAVFAVLILTSCATINQAYDEFRSKSDTTKGAIIGGSAGAVVGTVLGSQVGNPVEGFALGAAAGAGVGALVGSAIENQRVKDEQAEYERQIASMQMQRDEFLAAGSESGPTIRRERVAPGDRYFHRLAGSKSVSGQSMVSSTTAQGASYQTAHTTQQSFGAGAISQPSAARATLEESQQPFHGRFTQDIDKKPVEVRSVAKSKPERGIGQLSNTAAQISKDSATMDNTTRAQESSLLSKNPYAAADASAGSSMESVGTPQVAGLKEANVVEAASMNQKVQVDDKKDSNQGTGEMTAVASLNQNTTASTCPEGDAELRRAADATEFSAKLFHTRRAVRLCNNYIPGKLALARLYIELKRFEDAQFELENLLKIDPSNREASELLNKVRQMM